MGHHYALTGCDRLGQRRLRREQMDGHVRQLVLDVADGTLTLSGGVSEHGDTSSSAVHSGAAPK